jgi:hypothetical protein
MPTEFDFIAGTEVAKFIAANNQVDYIQGPLGSGKTVALLLRAMRHAQEQKPSPIDNIRVCADAAVAAVSDSAMISADLNMITLSHCGTGLCPIVPN